ncbi:hypothetical protein [Amycolatopsis pithecellobii]|uniref:Uncharacterized protein n=1 Tax=Amycolatopsis pithecellobii TaxID=664692 RepID=A0A6N7Z5I4_9PSEU|nr:hypothetical protein [Amycolatopsis pithecellobii]MTD57553.1 hypothetical protein [Amycolatopsis pithecellobii]
MTSASDRVERLCTMLDDAGFEQLAGSAGAGDVLRRVLTAIREGGAEPDIVSDLDTLDDLLARAGMGMVTQPGRGYRPLPAGHSLAFWGCPAERPCARIVTIPAIETGGPPRCAITGRVLGRRSLGA